jgi:hypothetical protein
VDLLNNPPEGEAEDFGTFIENELDVARRSLNEVTMMLEQSQAELSKLTQRNRHNLKPCREQISRWHIIMRSMLSNAC